MPHNSFEQMEDATLAGSVRAYRWKQRDNGLEVVLSPRPGCQVAAVQMWYRVGSIDEEPERTGLAHFFEHMMFRGTREHAVGEYDRILEALGCNGGTNAFTSKDYTAYIQEVPAGAVDRVLELEADRMSHLDLTDENVREEAGAVLDEKRRSNADVDSVRHDVLSAHAFTGQSSAWPILGSEEHIRQYSARSCGDFYSRWYTPDKACVVVCGDVEALPLLESIQQHFGSKSAGAQCPAVSRYLQTGRASLQQAIELVRMELAFPLPVKTTDLVDWDLLLRLLIAPEVGILEQALVEPGLILPPGGWISETRAGDHVLFFGLTLLPGVESLRVEDRLRNCLSRAEDWLDTEMLTFARTEISCDGAAQCSRLDDRAVDIGDRWIYDGGLGSFSRSRQRLADMQSEELIRSLQVLSATEGFVLTAEPL